MSDNPRSTFVVPSKKVGVVDVVVVVVVHFVVVGVVVTVVVVMLLHNYKSSSETSQTLSLFTIILPPQV